jgi:hypothetical protein
MRKVSRVFLLRQVDVDFKKIKKGDMFCLEIEENGIKETTGWTVALEDAQEDPNIPKEFFVPSDKVYFIIGKPEMAKVVFVDEKASATKPKIIENRSLQ